MLPLAMLVLEYLYPKLNRHVFHILGETLYSKLSMGWSNNVFAWGGDPKWGKILQRPEGDNQRQGITATGH